MTVILSLSSSLPLGDFEEGDWNLSRNGADEDTPIVISDSSTYGSGQCLETRVVSDGTINTYRAEISGNAATSPVGTNRGIVDGDERWIGFSVLCDEDNPELNTFNTTIFQILQSSGTWLPSGFAGPNLTISMSRGRFILSQAWDTTLDSTDLSVIKEITNVYLGTCYRNQWRRFVIHWIPNSTGAGTTEVFLDGRKVYSNLAYPNNYNQSSATQYLKFGNYTSSWKSSAPVEGTTTIWKHDYIMIGDETSSLAEMMDVVVDKSPIEYKLPKTIFELP